MSARPEAPENALRTVHGLRVQVPADWEDSSMYRFNAPHDEQADATGEGGALLQANVLISRHAKNAGDSAERFLELASAETKKSHPSWEVLRSGSTIYLDQVAAWQEARFTDPRTNQPIFQRQLAAPSWPRHFTLVTLTGTQAAVVRMSEQMGLVHLDTPPGGARVDTGTGATVGAKLVSR
jgi:hypothetical protein